MQRGDCSKILHSGKRCSRVAIYEGMCPLHHPVLSEQKKLRNLCNASCQNGKKCGKFALLEGKCTLHHPTLNPRLEKKLATPPPSPKSSPSKLSPRAVEMIIDQTSSKNKTPSDKCMMIVNSKFCNRKVVRDGKGKCKLHHPDASYRKKITPKQKIEWLTTLVSGLTLSLEKILSESSPEKTLPESEIPAFFQPIPELNHIPLVPVLAALSQKFPNESLTSILEVEPDCGLSSCQVVSVPEFIQPVPNCFTKIPRAIRNSFGIEPPKNAQTFVYFCDGENRQLPEGKCIYGLNYNDRDPESRCCRSTPLQGNVLCPVHIMKLLDRVQHDCPVGMMRLREPQSFSTVIKDQCRADYEDKNCLMLIAENTAGVERIVSVLKIREKIRNWLVGLSPEPSDQEISPKQQEEDDEDIIREATEAEESEQLPLAEFPVSNELSKSIMSIPLDFANLSYKTRSKHNLSKAARVFGCVTRGTVEGFTCVPGSCIFYTSRGHPCHQVAIRGGCICPIHLDEWLYRREKEEKPFRTFHTNNGNLHVSIVNSGNDFSSYLEVVMSAREKARIYDAEQEKIKSQQPEPEEDESDEEDELVLREKEEEKKRRKARKQLLLQKDEELRKENELRQMISEKKDQTPYDYKLLRRNISAGIFHPPMADEATVDSIKLIRKAFDYEDDIPCDRPMDIPRKKTSFLAPLKSPLEALVKISHP